MNTLNVIINRTALFNFHWVALMKDWFSAVAHIGDVVKEINFVHWLGTFYR